MLVLSRKSIGSGNKCKALCEENAGAFLVLELPDGRLVKISLIQNHGERSSCGIEAPQDVRVFRGEFFLRRNAVISELVEETGKPQHKCAGVFDDAYKLIEEEDAALRAQYARVEAISILKAA